MPALAQTYKLPQPQPRYDLENENRFRRTVQGAIDELSAAIGALDLNETVIDQISKAGAQPSNFQRPSSNFPAETFYPLLSLLLSKVSGSPLVDRFMFLPFVLSDDVTIDRLAVEVTSATGGSVFRLGIYNANQTTLRPTTLIVDGGELSAGTTGVKTATINKTLTKGTLYCSAFVQGTAQASYAAITGSAVSFPFCGFSNLAGALFPIVGWQYTATYGAFSADVSATSFSRLEPGNAPPVVFARYSTVG